MASKKESNEKTLERISRYLKDEKILPEHPGSITGTELVAKIQEKHKNDNVDSPPAENTIRHYISQLAHLETSPIAKLDGKFGYYRRETEEKADKKAKGTPGNNDLEERFREVFIKYRKAINEYPVRIAHQQANKRGKGMDTWKFPDVVIVRPSISNLNKDEDNSGFLSLLPKFGTASLTVTSVELKLLPLISSIRKDFFEAVSNSMWAQRSVLAYAHSADEHCASELRRLGSSYNVEVQVYGISQEELAKTNIETIRKWTDEEVIKWIETYSTGIDSLVTPPERSSLDWDHIYDLLSSTGTPFKNVMSWVKRCLDGGTCHYEEWEKEEKDKTDKSKKRKIL